jgi:hypothetical protein
MYACTISTSRKHTSLPLLMQLFSVQSIEGKHATGRTAGGGWSEHIWLAARAVSHSKAIFPWLVPYHTFPAQKTEAQMLKCRLNFVQE